MGMGKDLGVWCVYLLLSWRHALEVLGEAAEGAH